jgi:hypothetical protein
MQFMAQGICYEICFTKMIMHFKIIILNQL